MINRFFPLSHPDSKPPSEQLIPCVHGLTMRYAFKGVNEAPSWNSIKFTKAALLQLLSQEGVEGISFSHAHNGVDTTLVGLAVDAEGVEIVNDSVIGIENGERCPPFCP